MTTKILIGDCIARMSDIESGTVQTCVTSPPYWGLRDYGEGGQHGLEETPEAYVANMVEVFRAVRRCLRDDGTLWLNLGDSYRDKQLIGIPWRVAFALQADGWYLRSDIIWHKPNPMPESVTDRPTKGHEYVFLLSKSGRYFYDADAIREEHSSWNGVTRDSYRGGKGDERRGLNLSPQGAVLPSGRKEAHATGTRSGANLSSAYAGGPPGHPGGRNKRTVWTITTRPYSGAHFATMPPQLAELCIKAGTSQAGSCAKCGSPLVRVIEKSGGMPCVEDAGDDLALLRRSNNDADRRRQLSGTRQAAWKMANPDIFHGWAPACNCSAGITPCLVLDPYTGAGTTGLVAQHLRRSFVGCELNPEYAALAEKRIRMDSPLFSSVSMDEVTP